MGTYPDGRKNRSRGGTSARVEPPPPSPDRRKKKGEFYAASYETGIVAAISDRGLQVLRCGEADGRKTRM